MVSPRAVDTSYQKQDATVVIELSCYIIPPAQSRRNNINKKG